MLDGVGLREPNDTIAHPFAGLELPTLQKLGISTPNFTSSSECITRPIDANLGITGLPQSGTGQTTILTGINAAAHLGFHYGPWVSPSLRPLLEQSIFKRLGNVRLANYYPNSYLEALQNGKVRLNAIATSALAAGATLEQADTKQAGIGTEQAKGIGTEQATSIGIEQANGIGIAPMLHLPNQPNNLEQIRQWAFLFMGSQAKVTVFDQWWTDHLGHKMNLEEAMAFAHRLESFCLACLEFQAKDTLFLVTSDHGNFEDLRIKTHTRNPVPFAAVGQGAKHFMAVSSLVDIASGLEQIFQNQTVV